ncbi:MAG TPA: ornithine cyclodeaminase family protein [Burkholderiales bacterium]|nr:ornithine cyclodeaminase family protein [Burkholderiales bacterium]
MLILDNDDVEKLLDVDSCIDSLACAYRALADGTAVDRARTQTYVKLPEPQLSYCLKTMEGAIPGTGMMALRLTSDVISDQDDNGIARRIKLARGPGETYCGLIVLFSVTRLMPLAIIHDGYIQVFRVACTSALSARLLAREDAGDLGLLGSGGQAWAHLQAMRAVRRLRRVRIFSPDRGHREKFAQRAHDELGLKAEPVATAREAVIGADLVVAATNTNEPIVDGSWLAPGAHVISIVSGDDTLQRRELDDETLRRASIVAAHSKQIARDQNQGDLSIPVSTGILQWDQIYDLSELVAGRAPRRTHEDEITVFKNNVGLGLQFAAVAGRVYELAQRAGVGRSLPDAWFLEKLKP